MKTLTLKATTDRIGEVTAFVDEQLEALDCPMKAQMQIDLAIDELFSNISLYAYGDDVGEATIGIDFDAPTRTVVVTFTDSGVPYNPLAKADPDVTLSAEEREVGGLGIFLVKKTMDSMDYERRDGFNIVTIRSGSDQPQRTQDPRTQRQRRTADPGRTASAGTAAWRRTGREPALRHGERPGYRGTGPGGAAGLHGSGTEDGKHCGPAAAAAGGTGEFDPGYDREQPARMRGGKPAFARPAS